jgi:hypothetical protein
MLTTVTKEGPGTLVVGAPDARHVTTVDGRSRPDEITLR